MEENFRNEDVLIVAGICGKNLAMMKSQEDSNLVDVLEMPNHKFLGYILVYELVPDCATQKRDFMMELINMLKTVAFRN